MSKNAFSHLPDDLHASLRNTWDTGITPANALLNVPSTADTPNVSARIVDLPPEVTSITGHELGRYRQELDHAATECANELGIISFASWRLQEGIDEAFVRDALTKHFERTFLPLDTTTLQAVVDKLASLKRSKIYAPLFTVWANLQRELGDPAPKLAVTWPTNREYTHTDFGQGMRNVDLTIKGRVQGNLGEKAINCQLTLDNFEGSLLDSAENSSVVGKAINGRILHAAQNSALTCETLKGSAAMYIGLSGGCTLQAKTVHCHTIVAREQHQDASPCTVTIGTLHGKIEPGKDWVVAIDETIDPPVSSVIDENIISKIGNGLTLKGVEEYIAHQEPLQYHRHTNYTPIIMPCGMHETTPGEQLSALFRRERGSDELYRPYYSNNEAAVQEFRETKSRKEAEDLQGRQEGRRNELSEGERLRQALGRSAMNAVQGGGIIEPYPPDSLSGPFTSEDDRGSNT